MLSYQVFKLHRIIKYPNRICYVMCSNKEDQFMVCAGVKLQLCDRLCIRLGRRAKNTYLH